MALFDEWPEQYDAWFDTPLGDIVREYEAAVILDLLEPGEGEDILDAGCGTGVFTIDILERGAQVTGLDISAPMLAAAERKLKRYPFTAVKGDMLALPFPDDSFDKVVSVTALEFIEDAGTAVKELFRVTRPGGRVVVATLNSLGPWAAQRRASREETVLADAVFRSPDDLRVLSPRPGTVVTAIHFPPDAAPSEARQQERNGQRRQSLTGAFLAIGWDKPAA